MDQDAKLGIKLSYTLYQLYLILSKEKHELETEWFSFLPFIKNIFSFDWEIEISYFLNGDYPAIFTFFVNGVLIGFISYIF